MQDNGERLLRFHVLYSAVLKQEFDREEFVADDLYAFQALERALRSGNQELRNHALHLQAQRQAEMESITVGSLDKLESTRRMPSIAAQEQAAEGAATEDHAGRQIEYVPVQASAASPAASPAPSAGNASPGHASPAAADTSTGSGERRSGSVQRLTPQEITRVTYLQRLYRQEFGRPLNVARFTMDDGYGREVLKEALAAANQELVALARYFIDENGKPRQHRRGLASAAT